jgi:hypothetical protein
MAWDTSGDRLKLLEEGRRKWHKPLFMDLFMLSSWNTWKERNKMLFEGTNPTLASWNSRLKSNLLLLVHRTKNSLYNYILEIVAIL